MVDLALVVPQTHLSEDLVLVQIENSGVGILPAIESTFEDRKLEAYATFENRKLEAYDTLEDRKLEAYATLETQNPNLDDALAEG